MYQLAQICAAHPSSCSDQITISFCVFTIVRDQLRSLIVFPGTTQNECSHDLHTVEYLPTFCEVVGNSALAATSGGDI